MGVILVRRESDMEVVDFRSEVLRQVRPIASRDPAARNLSDNALLDLCRSRYDAAVYSTGDADAGTISDLSAFGRDIHFRVAAVTLGTVVTIRGRGGRYRVVSLCDSGYECREVTHD